jgi:hypothetical protein
VREVADHVGVDSVLGVAAVLGVDHPVVVVAATTVASQAICLATVKRSVHPRDHLARLTEDQVPATTVARKGICLETALNNVMEETLVVRMTGSATTVERVVICRGIVLMADVLGVAMVEVVESATSVEERITCSVTVRRVVDTAAVVVELDATTVMKWVTSQEIVQSLLRSLLIMT